MNYREKIYSYLKMNNGIITTQYCREAGIPRAYLSRLVDEKKLKRVDRGVYISKNGNYDEYYFFQYKFKRTVFSYETALHLQGLTDKIPQVIEVSVPYSYKINSVPSNVKLYYLKNEIFDLGAIEVKTIYQNKVRAYNLERIICDFVQNKGKIDPEIYVKTIREYASSKNPDINKLFIYAQKMGITEKVRTTLEVVYE